MYVCDIMSYVTLCVTIFRMRLCSWWGVVWAMIKPPLSLCPSGSQLLKREPPAPPFPSLPATVTEHISEAGNTRHGGGGEARLRLLFRGCQVSHPPLLPLPPLGCRSPQRQQTKAPQPPTRRSLLPPRPVAVLSGIQSPQSRPTQSPIQPHPPSGRGRTGTSGAAGPGAASRAPPCGSGQRGGFGGEGRVRV